MKKICRIYTACGVSQTPITYRTREVIAAIGDGGNIIYIDRKNQIVVAITAYFKPMVFDRVEYIEKNIVEELTER